MSSPFSPSFKFNPFGPGLETPPPSIGTFARSHWGSEMAYCHLPTTVDSPGPLLGHQQRTSNRFPDCNSPGTWKYNPDFGLVHTGICPACAAYVEHIMAAMNYKDTAIAEAMKARRDDSDLLVLDSYRLGISRMMDENRSLREELERFKMRWTNLEDDYRYLWSSLMNQKCPIMSSVACVSDVGSASSSSSSVSSMNSFSEFRTHGITFTSPGPNAMETESLQKSQMQVKKPPQPHSATYASVASTHTSQRSPPVSQMLLPSNVTTNSSSGPCCGPVVAFRVRRDKQGRPKFPKTIHELKDLMSLAGEPTAEGGSALSIIKKMCLDAHATPREDKTPIQKWILMNWRNPYTPANANMSQADIKPNPRIDDPVDIWFDYLCTHPHSWPKGVRKDPKGRPVMSDLIANRAVARMRPTESASVRNDFVAQVTDMFSSPGMYQQLLEKNGFTVAPLITYTVFTGPITVDDVALHFARSGITPSVAMNNFEPWARHYKEC